MKKALFSFIFSLFIAINFTGCGGESGGSDSKDSNDNSIILGSNQAALGPLSGATMYAYRLTDLNTPIETVISASSSTDLDIAGSFDMNLIGIPNDEWIVVKAVGGIDIDVDDDNIVDTIPTINQGTIYGIAKASDWRSGINITAISDIIYKSLISENIISDLNSTQINSALTTLATEWLNDIDGDGDITYKDITSFKPKYDKDKSKMLWDTILNDYISGIHNNHDDEVLKNKLNFVKKATITGYTKDNNTTATYVNNENDETYIIKTVDINQDGDANAAIIEQSKDKIYSKTKVYQNTLGNNGIEYNITNNKGDTLTLLFNGEGNLLSSMNEYDLQDLANNGKIFFEETLDMNGSTYMKLDFPKSIMSLWSDTNVTIKLNDTYIEKEYLRVIDDDPVIGWYPPCRDENGELVECGGCVGKDASAFSRWWNGVCIDYEIPGADEGDEVVIIQEPIVYNNGGIKFSYRDNCQNDEIELTTLSDIGYALIDSSGNYKLCAKHDNITLNSSNTGTRLLGYDTFTKEATYRTMTSNNIQNVYLGSDSNNYEVIIKISKDAPTDISYDGWSSAISFEKLDELGYVGDAEYTDSKLWIALREVTSSGTIIQNGVIYGTVTSPVTGKIWLDRNLGASRVCTSSIDSQCYGDYYQWGREADGHEKETSPVSSTQLDSLKNNEESFIYGNVEWITDGIDSDGTLRESFWSSTTNGICPEGFRVPTIGELSNETKNYDVFDQESAFNNFLKLANNGYRYQNEIRTNQSYYLTTTNDIPTGTFASGYISIKTLNIRPTVVYSNYGVNSTIGGTVRCIKD